MKQVELSCGHKIAVDAEALTRMQRIATDLVRPSKPNPPMGMRCPRCGKTGVVRSLSRVAEKVAAPLPPNPRPETRPSNPQTPPQAPAPPVAPILDLPAVDPVTAAEKPAGPRILIGGGPRTGKTTLANHLDAANALHTDDLINQHDWSAVSHEVASVWMVEPGPWIIEGVATVRALRKRLAALEDQAAKPFDLFVWLTEPKLNRTDRQESMAKGCQTVFDQIRGDLETRGVRVEIDPG